MAKLNLKSVRILQIREAFQQVYTAQSTKEFEGLINSWYYWTTHSQLSPMIKVTKNNQETLGGNIKLEKEPDK